jgi:nucleoside-diphosphate-sugar epimerase
LKNELNQKPIIIVSGASGFLGQGLISALVHAGYQVHALGRNPQHQKIEPGVRWFKCVLPFEIDEAAFEGGGVALIHCAAETQVASQKQAEITNVQGSMNLLKVCRKSGVKKYVFISSMSAHENALSHYGKTKLYVEKALDLKCDLAIRPGFIIGRGGVFIRLVKMIQTLPIIPLFYGGNQQIQTISLPDLLKGILNAIETNQVGILLLGEEQPVMLKEFYRKIAESSGQKKLMIPLPGFLALALFRLAEILKLRLPFTSENLLGLKQLRSFDVQNSLRTLNLKPKTMLESVEDQKWIKD